MGFNCGIIGLPNVGKSTIFNALSSAGAQASNYPFTTIDPNVGIVSVPDARLDLLNKMYHPKKLTPTTIEFVDIAGLVKGASRGEGLGNKFLGNIREVDAVVHVVRCFEDPDVIHVDGTIGPKRDIEVIETELIMADLDTVEKRLTRKLKDAKGGDKAAKAEADLLERLKGMLEKGEPVRTGGFSEDEAALIRSYFLLTSKPVLYAANVAEDDLAGNSPLVAEVREMAAAEGAKVVVICGKVESDIMALPQEERPEFLEAVGLTESGLDRLARAGYELLKLVTFFTTGEDEVKAWTIQAGTKAPQAAGVIHSDFERGFIRAEVVAYDDLVKLGSWNAAKEKGVLRQEGKEYVVKDGDCMLFRFNV
ncbi:MAG TPA: redox-regulated ATPase YchF [Nitrospirota bacterium]